MNKKIIISLSVIAAVATIAIGGTIAFFSDTETSTGNTFTAGEIDLQLLDVQVGQDPTDVNGALFTLLDMKPGDKGEKTLGLWVDSNPACGVVEINVSEDLDNDCTEPEGIDENAGTPACDAVGELNDKVQFVIWADNGQGTGESCDNVWQTGEQKLTEGTLTGNEKYYIGELPTTEATMQCYAIAYCFGTWNTDMTCNGSTVDNTSQSDSFKADLIVTAEQKRNQYNVCPIDGEIVD